MKDLLGKFAVVVGAVALSVGVMTGVAAPADAATHGHHAARAHVTLNRADSSWGY